MCQVLALCSEHRVRAEDLQSHDHHSERVPHPTLANQARKSYRPCFSVERIPNARGEWRRNVEIGIVSGWSRCKGRL